MPPRKRPAESAPEAERPAKRQTRSSGKAAPAPSSVQSTKTRRAKPTTRKRATGKEGDEEVTPVEANEDAPPPVKPRTRTKPKARPTAESLLGNETNHVLESAVEPRTKPRRGRQPKKKDAEEPPGKLQLDEDPASSETVVSEPNDASLVEKLLKSPSRRSKNTTQALERTRSPTMEVVIPKRGRPAKMAEHPPIAVNKVDVDKPAPGNTPPTTPKKRTGRPRGKQSNQEVSDQGAAEPSKRTSARSTRARKGPEAKLAVAPTQDDHAEEVEGVQTIQRVIGGRRTRTPAKSSRKSKRDVSELEEHPGEASDAGHEELPVNPAPGHAPPRLSENDYGSLFGDEETVNRDNDADDEMPDDHAGAHALQTRDPRTTSLASLPLDLHPSFIACQKALLEKLTKNTLFVQPETSPNPVAIQELTDLIDGTVHRAEGNSCLVLGPRGSGKSTIIDSCLQQVAATNPIILRLSGWVQTTDRHALREIAYQLLQQTGSSLLPDTVIDASNDETTENPVEDAGEENPFLEHAADEPIITLPPSSHLHSLIPVLLTLNRPVVVILDAFDLFALHPRQSLLYCLLDTVQSCRASSGSHGLAVLGVTTRVDTVQLLEKRVKSRFSGRTIRTAPPTSFDECLATIRDMLLPSQFAHEESERQWNEQWQPSIEKFLADKTTVQVLRETYSITRNLKVISRILTSAVVKLTPSDPYLSHKHLVASTGSQRTRPPILHLGNLSYPWLCLLIASAHSNTSGHENFTFEMLHEAFRKQLKDSASAPVMINGANIGMMRCSRAVLMNAFEEMVAAKIFVCSVAPASTVGKEFMKHRCSILFGDIRPIVERSGLTNLKKWLNKATEMNQSS
ncbi:hypothetical protein D9619_000655 [Psilocybe cf. subviscida]|uniref:Origin recognition complex subunit 4 n=1 Tax=Psilocybe cf. subviscida TaxID=2480587 RepID=A0A8H5BFE3_9AGAR|nr:hypothetical protein D9619_000655 [Psilocybe cf. subviscida]